MKRYLPVLVRAVALLLGLVGTQPVLADPPDPAPAVDARIQIVWPHDSRGNYVNGVGTYVNVEVYLFERGTTNPVPCTFVPTVRLHWAEHGTSGRPFYGYIRPAHAQVGRPDGVVGTRQSRTVDGKTFNYWLFNDVPTGYNERGEIQPQLKLYYYVTVDSMDARTNVWGHAGDQRTYLPYPDTPGSVGAEEPAVVDTFLNIVWPHDYSGNARPVIEAPLANIGVDVIAHNDDLTRPAVWVSVPKSFSRPLRLWRSLNDGYLEPLGIVPSVVEATTNRPGVTPMPFPRWTFNDVDVAAAMDANNRYFFMALTEGGESHPTIWAHGADPRTYFPARDVPARSCQP